MSDQRNFLFVLGSSRAGGNTEALARLAAEQLPSAAGQSWLDLSSLRLPRFADARHIGDGSYARPEGDLRTALDATLAATDVVIVSPLYWYSVSAEVKGYLDHWSGWMRVPGVDFKARMRGKRLWGVSVLSEEDETVADPLAGMLRNTASYLSMEWGGVLLGYGDRPGDIRRDVTAARAAKAFFA